MTGAASRGDDLVVVQEGTNRTAVRWADGSWSEVPGIDADGFWFYRTVGATVAAGGYRCESLNASGECVAAEPSFFLLAQDSTGWRELDAPDPKQPLSTEVELTAAQGLRDWGLFGVGGADIYLLGSDGVVSLFSNGYLCAVDDKVVEPADVVLIDTVDPLGRTQQERFFTTFRIRSLAEVSDPPRLVAAPEPIPMAGEQVCGAGYASTVAPGGTTEWALDVEQGTVTRFESNTNAVGAQGSEGLEAGSATSPDGTTLFKRTGSDGRTMRRTGLDPWEDTGLELSGVWATETGVIGLEAGTDRFVDLAAT